MSLFKKSQHPVHPTRNGEFPIAARQALALWQEEGPQQLEAAEAACAEAESLRGPGLGASETVGFTCGSVFSRLGAILGLDFGGSQRKHSPLCGLFLCLFPDYFRIHFGGGWRKSLPTPPNTAPANRG